MKPPLGIYGTEMCVRCLKRKAKSQCGHVMVGSRKIAAGWCSKRCMNSMLKSPGCVGHWVPAMNPSNPEPAKERGP